MILAHRIALDPTVEQAQALMRACGVARFTWNWALSKWKELYEQGEKPNAGVLKKLWNSIKRDKFPWVYESPKGANQQPFTNLQKAFTRFFQKKSRYPRYKKRGIRDSFYVENDQFEVSENYLVRLPLIRWIRVRENLRFPNGNIMSGVISREADRWFLSVQVEVTEPSLSRVSNGVIGADLGLTSFLTLSTGEKIEAPKPLKDALRKLKQKQRVLSRRVKGSKRRAKARTKVARLHVRVKNVRQDFLNKLSTRLCRENQAIGLEDLNVKGMKKNRNLARSISDAGWGEFRRQMEYKSKRYGTQLYFADTFYPSTKKCSRCGNVKSEMSLSQRKYHCTECGFTCDRDWNAARNLRSISTAGLAGTNARGQESSDITVRGSVKLCLVEARTTPETCKNKVSK